MRMLAVSSRNSSNWRRNPVILGRRWIVCRNYKCDNPILKNSNRSHGKSFQRITVSDYNTTASTVNVTFKSRFNESLTKNTTFSSFTSPSLPQNNIHLPSSSSSLSFWWRDLRKSFSTSVSSSSINVGGKDEEKLIEGMYESYQVRQPYSSYNMNADNIDDRNTSNFQIITPKLWLNNHYQKLNSTSPMKRPTYRVFYLENEQKVLRWIAMVSCPTSISKNDEIAADIVFTSGALLSPNNSNESNSTRELVNIPTLTDHQSTSDDKFIFRSENDLSSFCDDGILSLPIITYRSKKDAEQAAAARAIDFLVRRDYNTQHQGKDKDNDNTPPSPKLLCQEEPNALSSTEIFLQENINTLCQQGYLNELITNTTKSSIDNNKSSTTSTTNTEVTNDSTDSSGKSFAFTYTNFLKSSNNRNIKEFLLRYYDSMKLKRTSKENSPSWSHIESTPAQIVVHGDDDPNYQGIKKKDNNKQKKSSQSYPRLNSVTLHHATFTCPLTGESFPCGTLLHDKMQNDNTINPHDSYRIGDMIYYTKIKSAEQAAYARALDCFSYRYFHDNENDDIIRMCLEEPYLLESLTTNLDVNNVDGANDNDYGSCSEGNDDNDIYDSDYEDDDEYTIQLVPGASSSSLLSNCNNEYNGSKNHQQSSLSTMERILEAWADVPTTSNDISTNLSSSFIHNENEEENNYNTIDYQRQSHYGPTRRKRREEALSNALAWYKRMEHGIISSQNLLSSQNQKSQFAPKVTAASLRQTPVSVLSCNAILNTLANVNFESLISYPYHSNKNINNGTRFQKDKRRKKTLKRNKIATPSSTLNPNIHFQDIESLAQQIIYHMSQDFDGNTATHGHNYNSNNPNNDVLLSPWSRRPNTETYNAYIKCLRRSTPLETAMAAEEILEEMNGNSDLLSRPNVGTYNAVLGLWSAIRTNTNACDDSNYSKVKEIYQQLLQQYEIDNAAYIRPNRQTFLTCLSSLANHSNIRVAKKEVLSFWIPEMKKFAKKYDELEFNIEGDVDIFNAVLPWSGGLIERNNVNHMLFPFPWDDYSIIFQHGFHPNNKLKDLDCDDEVVHDHDYYTKKAEAMEEWVHQYIFNNKTKMSPNIRTYESMIQAWARTGTRDGLEKAEFWAMQLCSNSDMSCLSPRTSTFYPIIAAWALCGDEQGYDKVQEWIDKIPNRELDNRCLTAKILALKSYPFQLSKRYGIDNTNGNENVKIDYDDVRIEDMEILLEKSFNASKESMICLEQACNDSLEKHLSSSQPLLVDAYNFGHVLNSWRDTAKLASFMIKKKSGEQRNINSIKTSNMEHTRTYAISQMLRTIELFDQLVEYHRQIGTKTVANTESQITRATLNNDKDFSNSNSYNQSISLSEQESQRPPSQQLLHFFRVGPYFYSQAVSSLIELDHYEIEKQNSGESIFVRYFPQVERMLRHSEDCRTAMMMSQNNDIEEQTSLQMSNQLDLNHDRNQFDDCFDFGCFTEISPWNNLENNAAFDESRLNIIDSKQDPNLSLYSNILKGCMELSKTTYYGDAIRLSMFIFDKITAMSQNDDLESSETSDQNHTEKHSIGNNLSKKDVTELYLTLFALIEKAIPQEHERSAVVNNILVQINNIQSYVEIDLERITKSAEENFDISKKEMDDIFRSFATQRKQYRKKSVIARTKRNSDVKGSASRRRIRRKSKSNYEKRNVRKIKASSSN